MKIRSLVTELLLSRVEEVVHYKAGSKYFVKMYLDDNSDEIHAFDDRTKSMKFFNFVQDNAPNIV